MARGTLEENSMFAVQPDLLKTTCFLVFASNPMLFLLLFCPGFVNMYCILWYWFILLLHRRSVFRHAEKVVQSSQVFGVEFFCEKNVSQMHNMGVPKNLGNQPQDLLISLPPTWAVEKKRPRFLNNGIPATIFGTGASLLGCALTLTDTLPQMPFPVSLWGTIFGVLVGKSWDSSGAKKKNSHGTTTKTP